MDSSNNRMYGGVMTGGGTGNHDLAEEMRGYAAELNNSGRGVVTLGGVMIDGVSPGIGLMRAVENGSSSATPPADIASFPSNECSATKLVFLTMSGN